MKLETSPNVTKSKRRLHWCRSISKKYLCRFHYSISQKVVTLSGRRFITVSGVFITLSVSYYIIGRFLLHYRARITVSGVYYIIGWYKGTGECGETLNIVMQQYRRVMVTALQSATVLSVTILLALQYVGRLCIFWNALLYISNYESSVPYGSTTCGM